MAANAFYERAVALDKTAHQALRMSIQPDHFAFARATNAFPLSASEFADAGRHYPIVFVGDETNGFHPAALVGLEEGSNLFVSAAGEWLQGAYIPAFARRYPFVLGTTPGQDGLVVYLDEAYAGLNRDEGMALFENGQESDYLKQMVSFLNALHREMEGTRQAVGRLHQLGLLTARSITISQDGQSRRLGGFWVVDDEKFAAIDDALIVELHRSGLLRMMELHRASLGCVQRLAERLEQLRQAVRH